MLVDVLGVVTSVGPMRSIKRKNDGTEFFCRDITIADAGCASHAWRPLHASVMEETSCSRALFLRLDGAPTTGGCRRSAAFLSEDALRDARTLLQGSHGGADAVG